MFPSTYLKGWVNLVLQLWKLHGTVPCRNILCNRLLNLCFGAVAPAIVTFEVRVSRVHSLLLWVACYLQPCHCLTCWHGSCHHPLPFTFIMTQVPVCMEPSRCRWFPRKGSRRGHSLKGCPAACLKGVEFPSVPARPPVFGLYTGFQDIEPNI